MYIMYIQCDVSVQRKTGQSIQGLVSLYKDMVKQVLVCTIRLEVASKCHLFHID